ncbi:MAG: transporter permease [Deltaproteobacteria bacterium]|jgi:branched-chain amino acid transport system permease protein|nr:transporter permease [Deltaproteobacteria bacterium]
MTETTQRWKSIITAACFGAFALVVPALPEYAVTLATSILITSIYVSSANLLTGYTGLVSLGQAIFWGSAAYVVAILSVRAGITNFFLLLLVALCVVVLISAFFGVLALRVKRLYFMIVTFAFGHVVWCVAMYPMQGITRGYDGIKDIARPDLGLSISLTSGAQFYYFVLVIAALCFLFIYLVTRSPFGRAMMGIRDNEHRMVALGYNTFLYKYITYVLSAIIAGIAGMLFAYFNGYVNPAELHWLWSGDALMMMFIGGIGTLWGPLWGALAYTGLRYWISSYTMYWFGIEGIIFILVVLFFRGGIAGFVAGMQRRLSGGRTKD